MQFDVEKLLLSDPATLRAWHTYREGDGVSEPPWEFELRCATGDEQQAFMRRFGKKEPSAEEWGEFWRSHVCAWRGLRKGADELPMTDDLLKRLWQRDAEWRLWLVTTSQKLENFR